MNSTTNETARRRGRKVAAVLAGGLVLGVGTMATLASWNDSEYAKATFTSGYFNLEGAVDTAQSNFSEHASAAAAGTVSFTAPVDNLTPGDVVAAPYALRLGVGTTNDAEVSVAGITTNSGSVANLTYKVVQTTSAGCTTTTTGTEIVPAGTAVGSVTGASSFDLSKGSSATAAGDPAYLCFIVTADAHLAQSQTGSVTWEFQAVSQ